MTITAKVQNHQVVLPLDLLVPEGTTVQVVLPEPPLSPEEARAKFDAWADRVRGSATSGMTTDEIMQMTRGED